MLTIRLQRIGKKKFPTYRLVISENARDTQDRFLELLGTFNPHLKENQFLPVTDRILYWISKGAQTSDTVHNMLLNAGIIKEGKKKKMVFISKKRAVKLGEKKSAVAKAMADKKAADVAATAAAEAKAVEEAAAKKAADEAEKEAAKAAAEAPAPETAAAPETPAADVAPQA